MAAGERSEEAERYEIVLKEKHEWQQRYEDVLKEKHEWQQRYEEVLKEKYEWQQRYEALKKEQAELLNNNEKRSQQPQVTEGVISNDYLRWNMNENETTQDLIFDDHDLSNISIYGTAINHNIRLTRCDLTNCVFADCRWSCDKEYIFDDSDLNGCVFAEIDITTMMTKHNNFSFRRCKNLDKVKFHGFEDENKTILDLIKKKFDL